MSPEAWAVTATVLLMLGLMGGGASCDYHVSKRKCESAGQAFNKPAEYSFVYGCFIGGVPSEMIREVTP